MRRTICRCLLAAVAGLTGCMGFVPETVVQVQPLPNQLPDPPYSPLDGIMGKKITSADLYTIYSRNVIDGALPNQRFLFRMIVISGVFEGIDRSIPGRPYLELGTQDAGAFTYAQPAGFALSLLSAFQPGERVTLVCWGAGSVGGSPMLRACRQV